MTATDYITAATAGIGAVLGVINTIWELRRDRIRIRVRPIWSTHRVRVDGAHAGALVTEGVSGFDRQPDGWIGVRVTNLGFTDVTIDSIGFTASGILARRIPARLRRMPIVSDAHGAVRLPVRLQARDSIDFWAGVRGAELLVAMRGVRRVYASTACGLDIFGSSPLLRRILKRSRSGKQ